MRTIAETLRDFLVNGVSVGNIRLHHAYLGALATLLGSFTNTYPLLSLGVSTFLDDVVSHIFKTHETHKYTVTFGAILVFFSLIL
jgi:hypothetical protein